MIQVESKKLNSDDCGVLARLTVSARKSTPLESDRDVEEFARNIKGVSANDDYEILTASDDEGNVVGWIYYYVAIPSMTFINGFLPVVGEIHESEKIAWSLIEASKRASWNAGIVGWRLS